MQSTETLDLDQFEDTPTAAVTLKNPSTGAPTAATIQLAGPQNPAHKNFKFDIQRKIQQEIARSGRYMAADPTDSYDIDTDFLVVCTLGWTGFTRGGELVPFSPDAARALYVDPKRQWVRSQVKKALDETDRFISSSVKP